MKQSRQQKILDLIKNNEVGTQEELLALLRRDGFDITQATVSRDIKELRLVKTLSKSGEYIYSIGRAEEPGDLSLRFDELFRNSVSQVDYVFNQVIVKCYTGLANAVCESLDRLHPENVVGTIAGDNTFLIIMRTEESAAELYRTLMKKM